MPQFFQSARSRLLLLSVLLVCSVVPVSLRAQGKAVTIPFTALGKDKRFVAGLRKEDIRISDEGVPQEITKLEQQTERPFSLVIMIDTSFSQRGVLPTAKRAAIAILDSLIRPGKDSAAVMSFASEAILEQGLTSDVERARKGIANVQAESDVSIVLGGGTTDPKSRPPGSSASWDAIWLACTDVLGEDKSDRRRAIILITDGQDTASMKKMTQAIDQALQAQVTIFAIGAGSKDYGIVEETLNKITERTGGRAFFPEKITELPPILAELEHRLRSQYLVTYTPTPAKQGGKMRKVKIEIVNPELRKQNLRLSYQQGYFK
ncbi:MAG: VWA domain-containing protein [Pyrinomonadaceae bacterium]|nr:VWA domain-containing protein [Pyrinomonadaceae bacterium]